MANWLQKIISPPATTRQGKSLAPGQRPASAPPESLPNATIIYGIGASLLFVSGFFLLLDGRWVAGCAVFAIGACLVGFALHLLKHQD